MAKIKKSEFDRWTTFGAGITNIQPPKKKINIKNSDKPKKGGKK